MKNIECESCIKRKTMFCPNSSKCWNTEDKPYWQNRIMLLEENQQLKDRIDKALEKINFYKTTEWGLRSYSILEIFEEILKGAKDDTEL